MNYKGLEEKKNDLIVRAEAILEDAETNKKLDRCQSQKQQICTRVFPRYLTQLSDIGGDFQSDLIRKQ